MAKLFLVFLCRSSKDAILLVPSNDIYEPLAKAALGGLAIPPEHELSVVTDGTGSGRVFGSGIDCGASCLRLYDRGSLVSLTAVPQSGSVFEGWSGGGCSGTDACVVALNADVTITALFSPTPIAVE